MSSRTPLDRPRLDRARVVAAAVAYADEHGLDAVSMRALAAELGVVPMALYKHVADKDDLVGGMIDLVVAGYAEPAGGLDWRDRVRARVHAARDALAVHPWLRRAIDGRRTRSLVVLAHLEAVAADLVAGGLSIDLVHHAMHALGHRIWGYAPEAFPDDDAGPAPDDAALAAAAARFPHIVAIAVDAGARSGLGACDDDAEFDLTLDLLLDAIERLRVAGWESRPLPGR